MKVIRFFSESYAVPADAVPGVRADLPKKSTEGLVAYTVYRGVTSRAIVYCGLGTTVPTSAMPMAIISAIARRERIKPLKASWFDLQTILQDQRFGKGEFKYYLVVLKKSKRLQGECVVEVPCPAVVRRDFAAHIAGSLTSTETPTRSTLTLITPRVGSAT